MCDLIISIIVSQEVQLRGLEDKEDLERNGLGLAMWSEWRRTLSNMELKVKEDTDSEVRIDEERGFRCLILTSYTRIWCNLCSCFYLLFCESVCSKPVILTYF